MLRARIRSKVKSRENPGEGGGSIKARCRRAPRVVPKHTHHGTRRTRDTSNAPRFLWETFAYPMGTRGAAIGVICGRGRVAQCQISEITYFKKQNKKNTQAGRFVSPPPPTPGVMPSYLNALASEGAGGLTCGLGGPTVAVLRARGPRGPAGPIAQQIADPTATSGSVSDAPATRARAIR